MYDWHPDQAGLKESDFKIVALDSPGELKNVLAGALGVRTVVRIEKADLPACSYFDLIDTNG